MKKERDIELIRNEQIDIIVLAQISKGRTIIYICTVCHTKHDHGSSGLIDDVSCELGTISCAHDRLPGVVNGVNPLPLIFLPVRSLNDPIGITRTGGCLCNSCIIIDSFARIVQTISIKSITIIIPHITILFAIKLFFYIKNT